MRRIEIVVQGSTVQLWEGGQLVYWRRFMFLGENYLASAMGGFVIKRLKEVKDLPSQLSRRIL